LKGVAYVKVSTLDVTSRRLVRSDTGPIRGQPLVVR